MAAKNSMGCCQAVKVGKSCFSNQKVIKFLWNWLENIMVPYILKSVLLTTEGLFWCWVGSGDLVAPSWGHGAEQGTNS